MCNEIKIINLNPNGPLPALKTKKVQKLQKITIKLTTIIGPFCRTVQWAQHILGANTAIKPDISLPGQTRVHRNIRV